MDRIEERKTVICLCALLLFLGFEAGGFQWSAGHMAEEYHLGPAAAGLIVGEKYAVMIAAPLLSGLISDHVGKKTALFWGICSFTAGCLLMSVPSIAGVIAANVLIGIGYSFTECTVTAVLAELPGGSRFVNYSQCMFCVGAVVSPILMEHYGWHWKVSFLIPGIVFLALLFPVMKFYASGKTAAVEKKKREPFRLGAVSALLLAIFFYGMIENGSVYYFMDLFRFELKVSYGAYAISAFWLAMAVGRFLSAAAKKQKGGLTFYYGLTFLALCYLGFGRNGIVSFFMAFALGLFCAPLWPELMLAAAAKEPAHAGVVIGCMSIASSVGGTVSPVLLGISETCFGGSAPFKVLAGAAVCGFAAAAAIKKSVHGQKGREFHGDGDQV